LILFGLILAETFVPPLLPPKIILLNAASCIDLLL